MLNEQIDNQNEGKNFFVKGLQSNRSSGMDKKSPLKYYYYEMD